MMRRMIGRYKGCRCAHRGEGVKGGRPRARGGGRPSENSPQPAESLTPYQETLRDAALSADMDERIFRHVGIVPSDTFTLHKLTQLSDERFTALLDDGRIHPGMTAWWYTVRCPIKRGQNWPMLKRQRPNQAPKPVPQRHLLIWLASVSPHRCGPFGPSIAITVTCCGRLCEGHSIRVAGPEAQANHFVTS